METAKEQDVLVCVRKDEEHVELSELDVCRTCGTQVWVSPAGRRTQRENDLKIVCMQCMPEGPDVAFAPMTREQALELLNYLKGQQGGNT